MKAVIAENLKKTYNKGSVQALDGLSLDVEEGTVLGVLGPNGAGKTTCFNVMTGVYQPTQGTVMFNGSDITKLKRYEITQSGIARTFQNIRLFSEMTAVENVMVGAQHLSETGLISAAFGRNRRDEDRIRDKARVALERVFAGGIAHRRADTLSYPDTKRVAIARALVSEPTILMLDEPAGGLGTHDIEWMNSLIMNLSMDMSVLLVEHHMDVVMSVCSKLYVLNFGEVIASGDAETVRRDPAVMAAYLGTGSDHVA